MNLNKTPIALALATLAAATHQSSLAQAAPDEPGLPAITVTSTRTERRVDAVPNTVTVTPASAIEKAGARDIKDVFRDELDVTVRQQPTRFSQSGGTARAGNEGINIRGLEGNQVLMLIDGIRVPNSFTFGPIGTGRGDFLNIDSAQSIEVLRGPASTQYGSDGLAGAVSLRTLEPLDLLKGNKAVGGFARAGYAPVDKSFNASVGVAGRSGPWRGMLLATQRQGHETDNQGTVDTQNGNRTTPNPVDYSTPSVLGKVFYTLNAAHEFGLTLESQQHKQDTEVFSARGTTTSRGVTTTINDLDTHDKLTRDRVSVEHHYDDESAPFVQRVSTQVYAQDAKTHQLTLTDRTVAGAASPLTRDYDYRQKVLGLSTQLESNFKAPLLGEGTREKLNYGIDVSRTDVTGQFTGVTPPKLFPDTKYTLAGAFMQGEIDSGAFSIIPGLRLDHYKLAADPSGYTGTVVSLSDQAVTPRIGAVWRLAETFAPYLNLAKGFRAPTPDQVNNGFANVAQGYTSIGNPNLKAERADSIEAGFRGRVAGLRYQLLGYDNRYKDFISQQVAGGTGVPGVDPLIYQYINLNNARIRGIEARAEWQIDKTWRVNAGSALSRGTSEVAGVKTPLDTVEPLRTVLGVRYDAGSWELRANALHAQGKQSSRISNATYFATPSYTVLDLGASWKPLPNLTLNANLNNVTDQKYWRWSDVRGIAATSTVLDAYTAPGRSVQVSARYDF
ncbi:MAG: TonB-dependent hemoglobin/transferrin/lactoferrin family receptor [Burkholderiales bacterium]|nr:TonB-dependent hemoglobin/transferrin/lactoferrin family receptor [Burkholderiales bacterium]